MAGAKKQFDLYPKNKSKTLDPRLFANPTAEYRGTPFWSWNNKLDHDQLFRQIDCLEKMGFGGFHIHARTGLATEYLGAEFLQLVKECTERAQQKQMLSWLYDEDRWPSGFAGGLVTIDEQYREKVLRWTMQEQTKGQLIGIYLVELVDGYLKKYKQIKKVVKPKRGQSIWYAYLETSKTTSWFNNTSYADTLSKPAIKRFIETTHEEYKKTVGDYFGTTIPAIFTDEPHFKKKETLKSGNDTHDVVIPFTSDFCQTYHQQYKQKLEAHLPEQFFDLADGEVSVVRYRYHDHLACRFAEAFGDQLGTWCGKNGIALTGHMLSEASLHGQSRAVGEVMRAMRGFQLPGIDMLSDKLEFVTAKQAQSLAHQYGRPGVTSELYGVTNWDFDFPGHKRQGDWQSAMGVSVRVPHLAWVSMAGEAKRDYPASISYQSPWYEEYPLVEDHFARLNCVMTRGKPFVRVGVIHPIESFWLAFGPTQENAGVWQQLQKSFDDVTNWLSYGLVDFDYLGESILPELMPRKQGKKFVVGKMNYDCIILPSMKTIRSTTLKALKQFAATGGKVIVLGTMPTHVDGIANSIASKLLKKSTCVPHSQPALLADLKPYASISAFGPDGTAANSLLHHMRDDGKVRQLFICNTDRIWGRDRINVRINGKWNLAQLDTHSGNIIPIPSELKNNQTIFDWNFPAHGHLLLALSKRSKKQPVVKAHAKYKEVSRLTDAVPITLSEPNVLLLDQAEWKLNDEPWNRSEELLRIDDQVRDKLFLKRRGGQIAQPYTDSESAPVGGKLRLKFTIESDIDVASSRLALEDAHSVRIILDGSPVQSQVTGWWTDEAIQTVDLPSFSAGVHELVLEYDFSRKTNIEWCYLLGDFGVKLEGRHARIIPPVKILRWGDWCHQGLPFYGGNVTYHVKIAGNGSSTKIELPRFSNPLLVAQIDGKKHPMAFAPFEIDLGAFTGEKQIDITAFGNRHNAFGPVHNTNENNHWVGPGAWRSNGNGWSYEYILKRIGILSAPIVKIAE